MKVRQVSHVRHFRYILGYVAKTHPSVIRAGDQLISMAALFVLSTAIAFAPPAQLGLARAVAPRASQPVCIVTSEDKALLAASKRVTMIAKRFGPTQGKAAQKWVEDALQGSSTSSAVLMEQQLALFDECSVDDESGRCKALSEAIDAMISAVAEKKTLDLPANEKLAAKWRQQKLFGTTPIQAAATKLRTAATKFGPEQKAAADAWIKKAASGEATYADGNALLSGKVMLFGECVLSEGSSPSNCQLLETALTELQDALETCTVAESAMVPQCNPEEVVDTVKAEAKKAAPVIDPSKWPMLGGSGGYHRMSGTGTRKLIAGPVYWPPIGGTSGPHRMAGRYAPKTVTVTEAEAEGAVAKARPAVSGRKRAAVGRLLRVVRGKPAWPALGGTSGAHRGAGRR